MFVSRYNFRYVKPSTNIFVVCKNVSTHMHQTEFLSTPFRRQNEISNVLTGFTSYEHAQHYVCQEEDISALRMPLKDFIDYASIIRMPCIVVTNAYCEIEEPSTDDNVCYELFFKDYVTQSTQEVLNVISNHHDSRS